MRWLVVLLVAARPAFADCYRSPDWRVVEKCHQHSGGAVLAEVADAKLVSYRIENTADSLLQLYVLREGKWQLGNYSGNTNAKTELLSFSSFAGGYRVDMGFVNDTRVTLDDLGTRAAWIKRASTTLCFANGICRSVTTSCDVLVRGRVVSWFRGRPIWDGTRLRVAGETRYAGRYCQVPKSFLAPEIE